MIIPPSKLTDTMTPEEEAEFEEDVRNGNVIFHI